jgi:hypothetical protein
MIIFNTIIMIAGLYWSKGCFDRGENFWGWMNLLGSSFNLAVVLHQLL